MARFRLDQKVALVTGGGTGIGAAICRAYAEQGARVVVADINPAGGQRVANELGEAACFQVMDVTDLSSVQAGVARPWSCSRRRITAPPSDPMSRRGSTSSAPRPTRSTSQPWFRMRQSAA